MQAGSERGLRALLGPLARRLGQLAARAVVRAVDDGHTRQLLQVEILQGELREGVERFQPYGLTCVPHAGSDAVVLSLGGHRAQAVIVAVEDRRYRLVGLAPGEVALFDDVGHCVHLQRDRIRIASPDAIELSAPTLRITANVEVTGDTTFNGRVSANGKPIDDTHTHVGVQPGGGVSGPPS
jgi:phage gp45-like